MKQIPNYAQGRNRKGGREGATSLVTEAGENVTAQLMQRSLLGRSPLNEELGFYGFLPSSSLGIHLHSLSLNPVSYSKPGLSL